MKTLGTGRLPNSHTLMDVPAISPDGTQLAGLNAEGRIQIVTLGGATRLLPTSVAARPVRWTRDGKALIAVTWRGAQSKLFRVDVATGAATFWKTVGPASRVGAMASHDVLVSDDEQSIVYGSASLLSELFVAHGWK